MSYTNTYHQIHDLETVMTYAVMAHDANDGYNKSTYRFGDGSPVAYSNRDIMLHSMQLRPFPSDEKRIFLFENTPDEQQIERARNIITYYTGLMIKALGSKINDFESKILSFVKSGEVPVYDFGMVAALPKSYARAVERDVVEKKQRELSDDSDFVGSVGDTLDIKIKVLRKNYIMKLGCDVVNAVDGNNNLMVFFTGKGELFEADNTYNIRARVKRHQMSNQHGGKETVLNYVKVVDTSV